MNGSANSDDLKAQRLFICGSRSWANGRPILKLRRYEMRTDSSSEQKGSGEQQASGARGGTVIDDVSKGAGSGSESEGTGSRGGVVGDDKSKGFGGSDDDLDE
jgi:hypothetical protein